MCIWWPKQSHVEFLSCDKLVYLLHEKRDRVGYMPSSSTVQARLRQGSFFSNLFLASNLLSVVLEPPATYILPG